MASDTKTAEPDHPVADHDGPEHPSEGKYWKIFWLLFVITAVEVLLFYRELPGSVHINNSALGVLAMAKFVIVVGYFMHLKFDPRILRRLFISGLVLAVLVYVAYLLTLGVFVDTPTPNPVSR